MSTVVESGYAPVSGGRLYYEVAGKLHDPKVVLIHAGFLDRRMWDEQFELFPKEGFRVLRYDMRGLGKSDKPTAAYDDAVDLKQLLDHLGISDKVSVAGVSNGGSTAIDFALAYPERLKRLILIAPTVNGYEFADAHEENLWKSIDKDSQEQERAVKENRLADAVDIQIKIVASALKGAIREKAFQVAMDNSQNFVKPVYEMQVKKDPPAFKRLSEIKTPTLLIWGDMDFPGQISLAERVNSLIPGSKRILIHGADHLVNLSQPTAFNRIVLNYLKSS